MWPSVWDPMLIAGGVLGGVVAPPPSFPELPQALLLPRYYLIKMCDKIAPQTGGFRGGTAFHMGFQHLFHRRSTNKSKDQADVTEAFKTLIDARFDRLESNFQLLRTEWADVHEKILLLYDRNRKRLKAMETASRGDQPIDPAPTIEPTRESVLRAYLTQNGA